MKTLISSLLLGGTLLVACPNDRHPPVEQGRTKPPVLPFHFAYYDYGSPPEPKFSKAQAVVLKRYGLSYYGFGCEVTDSLMRAIHRHNDSLFARLQPTHPGINENRLRREIQAHISTLPSGDNTRHP